MDDFGNETIQLLFSIGCDTARAVLELSTDEIVSRTNDEIDESSARKIIEVIAYEFED
jgi:N utilization substance protein A